jgi:hypothetical protein
MGFQELLDPHGNKRRRFDKLIDLVANAQRPKTDYRWLSHVDFLGLDFLRRLLDIQTSYMLLLRSFAAIYSMKFVGKNSTVRYLPDPIATKGHLSLEEILDWSHRVGTKEMYQIYCSYPHRGLITLFADLKLEEPFFDDEFVVRIADKPFTSELILLDWGGLDRKKEVEKLLRVNKKKSFRPEKQSDDDIRQSAWVKALSLWHQPGIELWRPGTVNDEVLTPLPEFPGAPYIKMLPSEKEFWEGPMARAWRDGKLAFLREGVPMLAGEKENIPEKVRQNQRNEWEKLARREKILKGQDDFPVDGPEAWRANWDYSESAINHRQAEIRDEIHPDLKERINQRPDVSSNLFKVLQFAKKRWGSNAAKAFKAMAEGATEKDAALRCGIPYQSMRRYVSKLKKEFSAKS